MNITGIPLMLIWMFAGLGFIFALFLTYILITGKKKKAFESAKEFGVDDPIEIK